MHSIDSKQFKREVGERIKTVRTANGFNTRAELTQQFPDWSESRLSNYESGTSLPSPVDILRIAEQTGTNPCWIQFGRGAMFSREPDIHQIRRQNLASICAGLEESALKALVRELKIKPREFKSLLTDPSAKIGKSLCRKLETRLKLESGSMDRQAVEISQAGLSPQQAELLAIFDGLDSGARRVLINLARDLQGLRK